MKYGVKGNAHDWFSNYLFGRTQQVKFASVLSLNIIRVEYGVPQRSVLGPSQFSLYVNNFYKSKTQFFNYVC